MWASEPWNNGAASPARRSVSEEAAGPETCAAAPARSVDFREGVGEGGRLWGHCPRERGPGVSGGCQPPRGAEQGARSVGCSP